MAKADSDNIRTLLTDTVTLLCRNSLQFTKELSIQGLIAITVDETDVYIIQIDEQIGDGGGESFYNDVRRSPATMGQVKRPRMTMTVRATPTRRMVQTVPRRGRGGITMSPSSAMARQRVRQQLNFTSGVQRPGVGGGPQMPNPAGVGLANAKQQMMKMRSPRLSAPSQMPQTRLSQSPRTPAAMQQQQQQSPRKKMLMLTNGKEMPEMTKQTPIKPKTEHVDPRVKMERAHGEVICVESDEEPAPQESKRMPDLVPYRADAGTVSATGSVEDDKTRALQAIMNEALNEARSANLGNQSDSYHDDCFEGFSFDCKIAKGGMPSLESVMGFDAGAQYQDDSSVVAMDTKPFLSWDSSPMHFWHQPTHMMPSQTASVQSTWIKTESTQQKPPQKMMRGLTGSTPLRSPAPSSASPHSHGFSPCTGIHRPAKVVAQDPNACWKSVTLTKFICSINNCDKEFTTKRAMRHHQKTIHGASMKGRGTSEQSSDSQDDNSQY